MDGSNWPEQRTAILVLHGIGSQFPFETLDMFTRPLTGELGRTNTGEIRLEHRVASRDSMAVKGWRENYIRITSSESTTPIDIYEYYWANLSENMVTLKDLQKWVSTVTAGANRFYKRNKELGKAYGDDSIFFNENGTIRESAYKTSIFAAFGIIPLYTATWTWLSSASQSIPWVGWLVKIIADHCNRKITDKITNYVGDVAVYNSLDPKSSFYKVRTRILGGAVSALRHIVDRREGAAADSTTDSSAATDNPDVSSTAATPGSPYYGRVVIAGHSLGSQIAFDAINRLTRMVSVGEISGVAPNGDYVDDHGNPRPFVSGKTTLSNIKETLCGLVTFGSPLDKIAFFLRDQAPDEQYLRCQMLENYHSFKQKPWHIIDENDNKVETGHKLLSPFEKIFDDIRWYNFHDSKDPVSGHLDYYDKVKNIPRNYAAEGSIFSHGKYWTDEDMFRQIIEDFINPAEPPTHIETESV